jgi:hypothetical protein
MTIASVMAESETPARDPGAPFPKGEVDPELVKLARRRVKFGVITCIGLVFLSLLFVWKLSPDRRFGGASSTPDTVSTADIINGNVAVERYVEVQAAPLVAAAIRSTTAKGTLGLRVVPARGTGERLWIVVSGDGSEPPSKGSYVGRLRKLDDLALASTVRAYAAEHARPMFATAAAVRAGFASNQLGTTVGETVAVGDRDRVAYDIDDPDLVRVACVWTTALPDAAAWQKALADAGVTPNGAPTPDANGVSFTVATKDAMATVAKQLGAVKLGKGTLGDPTRLERVVRHTETTWGQLKAAALDPKLDLVGVYVARAIPDDAYALVLGEQPDDYWYAMWATIGAAAIGLAFAWMLVRAVRRDLLPTRA